MVRFPSILDQPDTRRLDLDRQTLSSDLRVNSNINLRGHHLVGNPGGAYTPVWTAATTNPAIGNGTLEGRWSRNGNLVTYWGKIVMGSTTTYGSGAWFVSLPVPAAHSENIGIANYRDFGTAIHPGAVRVEVELTKVRFTPGSWASVGATVPFTWTTLDELRWQITYEVAA